MNFFYFHNSFFSIRIFSTYLQYVSLVRIFSTYLQYVSLVRIFSTHLQYVSLHTNNSTLMTTKDAFNDNLKVKLTKFKLTLVFIIMNDLAKKSVQLCLTIKMIKRLTKLRTVVSRTSKMLWVFSNKIFFFGGGDFF